MGKDVGWANLWSCAGVVVSEKVRDDNGKCEEEQWEVVIGRVKMTCLGDFFALFNVWDTTPTCQNEWVVGKGCWQPVTYRSLSGHSSVTYQSLAPYLR